jgi:proton-dependent oligopeptide transporter, POT family
MRTTELSEPGDGLGPGFFGHPRGLMTLFFTEMWERFSYYGMRALLVLFMVDSARGGLGFDDRTAAAIYGIYTAAVYLVCLPGGWVADRLIGQQRAVWYGGMVIMFGHFTLALPAVFPALPEQAVFYFGLLLIVLGTGLLKPNVSAIVGRLYPDGGARRDAGFSVFYMGINVGATLGPLVCSSLGEKVNWHYGFGAAGVGMLCGLIQYRLTQRHLGTAGWEPEGSGDRRLDALHRGRDWRRFWVGLGLFGVLCGMVAAGVIPVQPLRFAQGLGLFIVGVAVAFMVWVLVFGRLTRMERRHVLVIGFFFVGAALFWSGFEQAGSSLNLFAERHTDRSWFGGLFHDGEHPAGYYQSVNAVFIIMLAPFFAGMWVNLARRNMEPSAPMKFALGLLQLGLGFGVIALASLVVLRGGDGTKVWPTWLILMYLLHTTGELCLSPIGLSWVTKLSPPRYVGQMMGVWFMGAALGNLVGGLVAGHFGRESVEQMPERFGLIVATLLGTAVLFAACARPIRRLIGDVR